MTMVALLYSLLFAIASASSFALKESSSLK